MISLPAHPGRIRFRILTGRRKTNLDFNLRPAGLRLTEAAVDQIRAVVSPHVKRFDMYYGRGGGLIRNVPTSCATSLAQAISEIFGAVGFEITDDWKERVKYSRLLDAKC